MTSLFFISRANSWTTFLIENMQRHLIVIDRGDPEPHGLRTRYNLLFSVTKANQQAMCLSFFLRSLPTYGNRIAKLVKYLQFHDALSPQNMLVNRKFYNLFSFGINNAHGDQYTFYFTCLIWHAHDYICWFRYGHGHVCFQHPAPIEIVHAIFDLHMTLFILLPWSILGHTTPCIDIWKFSYQNWFDAVR